MKEMRSPYTGEVVKTFDCASRPGIMDALELAAREMCDNYCKWPDVYRMNYKDVDEGTEAMYEERCKECPMIDILA